MKFSDFYFQKRSPNAKVKCYNRPSKVRKAPDFFRNPVFFMWSLQQVDTMLQLNTLQHLHLQCIILQSLYRSTTQSIILPANSPFLIQTEVRVPTECGAYNKLIQCYSLIQCNTCQYNVAFPNTLYRSHDQIVFLPAKHTVFRTISGRFSSEWQQYNKLIQFVMIQSCNT